MEWRVAWWNLFHSIIPLLFLPLIWGWPVEPTYYLIISLSFGLITKQWIKTFLISITKYPNHGIWLFIPSLISFVSRYPNKSLVCYSIKWWDPHSRVKVPKSKYVAIVDSDLVKPFHVWLTLYMEHFTSCRV